MPATTATVPNPQSFLEQPATVSSNSHDSCHSPIPFDNHSSFANMDLFKLEDIGDDLLIYSSEPMAFDDSIMSLIQEEEESNSAPSLVMDQSPVLAPVPVPLPPQGNAAADAHVLHRTVVLFPNDASLVQTALVGSPPQAVLSPSPVPHHGYSYPLHMALCQGASLQVLQLLVQAGPQVLMQKDGPQGFTPLMLALTLLPNRSDAHQLLHKALPQAAGIVGGEDQELPLHVACRNTGGSSSNQSVSVVQELIRDYPAAVVQTNRRGLTPLNIVALQPATAPHRSIVYQSLQRAVLPHKPTTMGRGGHGIHLTAPC